MKKKITLLALSVFTVLLLQAQDMPEKQTMKKENKMYLALSVGPSVPLGKFGSKSTLPEDGAGFANTGIKLGLHYGYLIGKNFGLASNIGYARYKLDEDAINSMMVVDDPTFKVSADHWQYYSFLVGPMATVTANDKLNFDFKVLGGLTHTNFPVISAATSSSSASSSENWQSAFAWQLETTMRYHFNPRTCFFTNFDYLKTKPVTNITITNGGTESSEVEQHISVISLTVGVGLAF